MGCITLTSNAGGGDFRGLMVTYAVHDAALYDAALYDAALYDAALYDAALYDARGGCTQRDVLPDYVNDVNGWDPSMSGTNQFWGSRSGGTVDDPAPFHYNAV